jgi:transposase
LAAGAVVADVARRADISAGQIYRWRQELRTAAATAGFTPVLIASAENSAAPAEDGPRCAAEPAIEVEFAGKVKDAFSRDLGVATQSHACRLDIFWTRF